MTHSSPTRRSSDLQPQAVAAGLILELQARDGSCPIHADREQLARAVTHLIDHALRYTPQGGHVVVTCGTTAGRAWFTVTDTGPGIDPTDLPHLFRPRYRRDSTRGAATGGPGLGRRSEERRGGQGGVSR